MKATPDTITEVRVFLTATEIGKALANRCDDEQVDAIRAWVAGFDDNTQAQMQAVCIGRRLFAEAMMSEKAIDFLRTILYSVREDAKGILAKATVPGEVQP